MTQHPILAMTARWREQVAEWRRWGINGDILEEAARELEAMLEECIPPAQAAAECPFVAEQTIRNKLSTGELENRGERGRPLVRRGDLWGAPKAGPRAVDPVVRRRIIGGR